MWAIFVHVFEQFFADEFGVSYGHVVPKGEGAGEEQGKKRRERRRTPEDKLAGR